MRLPADLGHRLTEAASGLTGEHRLRADVVPGEEVTISTRPVVAGYRRAVTLEPFVLPGGLGPHKWRDRRLLEQMTVTEALITEVDGEVLETARGNLFAVIDGVLVTPPCDGRLLPGVTRATVLGVARDAGLVVAERRFGLSEVGGADELFRHERDPRAPAGGSRTPCGGRSDRAAPGFHARREMGDRSATRGRQGAG